MSQTTDSLGRMCSMICSFSRNRSSAGLRAAAVAGSQANITWLVKGSVQFPAPRLLPDGTMRVKVRVTAAPPPPTGALLQLVGKRSHVLSA